MTDAEAEDPRNYSTAVCRAMGRFCDRMAMREAQPSTVYWRTEAKRWWDEAHAREAEGGRTPPLNVRSG